MPTVLDMECNATCKCTQSVILSKKHQSRLITDTFFNENTGGSHHWHLDSRHE